MVFKLRFLGCLPFPSSPRSVLVYWVVATLPSLLQAEPARRFEYSFRGGAPVPPALARFGPEAEKVMTPTPQGLRIDLPAKSSSKGAVGITPRFRLAGDFVVAVQYELLYADPPTAGMGSGVKVWLQLDSPSQDAATIAHVVTPKSKERIVAIQGGKGLQQKMKGSAARSKKGTLKIERKADEVVCYEGDPGASEPREIYRGKMPTSDVQSVRVSANAGAGVGKLGICITDIVLAADRQPGATSEPKAGGHWWRVLGVLALMAGGGTLGAWAYARRRSRAS